VFHDDDDDDDDDDAGEDGLGRSWQCLCMMLIMMPLFFFFAFFFTDNEISYFHEYCLRTMLLKLLSETC